MVFLAENLIRNGYIWCTCTILANLRIKQLWDISRTCDPASPHGNNITDYHWRVKCECECVCMHAYVLVCSCVYVCSTSLGLPLAALTCASVNIRACMCVCVYVCTYICNTSLLAPGGTHLVPGVEEGGGIRTCWDVDGPAVSPSAPMPELSRAIWLSSLCIMSSDALTWPCVRKKRINADALVCVVLIDLKLCLLSYTRTRRNFRGGDWASAWTCSLYMKGAHERGNFSQITLSIWNQSSFKLKLTFKGYLLKRS
jgi:hypothetical protein